MLSSTCSKVDQLVITQFLLYTINQNYIHHTNINYVKAVSTCLGCCIAFLYLMVQKVRSLLRYKYFYPKTFPSVICIVKVEPLH